MQDFIIRVLVAGGIMGVFDAVWLSIVANKFYKSQIGKLLLEKPDMTAAVIFYVIYVVGIVAFVINPALEKGSWQHAVGYGAFALGRSADGRCRRAKFLVLAPWLICIGSLLHGTRRGLCGS